MKWIIDGLLAALSQLKRGATWLVLGLVTGILLLAWEIIRFALRTDALFRVTHVTTAGCRELTNGPIIFLFCGMIFFLFSVIVTFGEIQRYFYFRQRAGGHFQARQAMIHGTFWSLVAIAIAVAALVFFGNSCR